MPISNTTTLNNTSEAISMSRAGEPSALRSCIIWGCVAGFYLYELVLRVAPGVMTNQLMQTFAINATAIGLLTSSYYYPYSLLQIPCGLIVDRFGVRRVVTVSAIITALGCFFFAISAHYSTAILGQALIGTGASCAFLSSLRVSIDWFSPKRFALLSGLTNLMGILGSLFGQRPLAMLINYEGWRLSMGLAAISGLGIALLVWLVVRDRLITTHYPVSQSVSILSGLKLLVKMREMWFVGAVAGLTYIPFGAFAIIWAVPFLMQTYGIDNTAASTANSILIIGYGVGGPISVFLSDFFKRRILTINLAISMAALLFIIIIFVPHISLKVMYGLLFAAGLCTGAQILCFACAKEMVSHEISGTTLGFTNTLITIISAVLVQPLLGNLLDWAWDGQMRLDGVPLYNQSAFQFALSVIPICLFLSVILMLFVRETHPEKATVVA